MTAPPTDEQIEAMLHKCATFAPKDGTFVDHVRLLDQTMRAFAAECKRRIDPADHEQTVQACLAYERENDALRAEVVALEEHSDRQRTRAKYAEAERDEARAEVERLRAERDAYKRAKTENDDRFMGERDEARAEVERLRAELESESGRIRTNAHALMHNKLQASRFANELNEARAALAESVALIEAYATNEGATEWRALLAFLAKHGSAK